MGVRGVRVHKSPPHDSFQRAASESITEERQRQGCRQGDGERERHRSVKMTKRSMYALAGILL